MSKGEIEGGEGKKFHFLKFTFETLVKENWSVEYFEANEMVVSLRGSRPKTGLWVRRIRLATH